MNFLKDRYSWGLSLCVLGGIPFVLYVLPLLVSNIKGNKKEFNEIIALAITAVAFISVITLIITFKSKARINNTDEIPDVFGAKKEDGCNGFVSTSKEEFENGAFDGVKFDNVRYKMIDGGNYIYKNGKLDFAGFGTKLISKAREKQLTGKKGNGLIEPSSIQNDNCWN